MLLRTEPTFSRCPGCAFRSAERRRLHPNSKRRSGYKKNSCAIYITKAPDGRVTSESLDRLSRDRRPGVVELASCNCRQLERSGFAGYEQALNLYANHAIRLGATLNPGALSESVTVVADNSTIERDSHRMEEAARKINIEDQTKPSQNVTNLQRQVAGVLPVQMDVPRAGKSHRFVRLLVLREETRITFQYKSK